MVNYIVDASVLIESVVEGLYTINAENLILNVNPITRLLAPEFCLLECTNVIWKRVRFQNMPQLQGEILVDELKAIPLQLVSVKSLLPRALQIGLAHKLAIYDSVYIALAERYKFPLITADAKQETAARTIGVTIKPITEF